MKLYLDIYEVINKRIVDYEELKFLVNKINDKELKSLINNFINYKNNRRLKKLEIIGMIEDKFINLCQYNKVNELKFLIYRLQDYSYLAISHFHKDVNKYLNYLDFNNMKNSLLLQECLFNTREFIKNEIIELINN